jgi:hypothetical protein
MREKKARNIDRKKGQEEHALQQIRATLHAKLQRRELIAARVHCERVLQLFRLDEVERP